MTIKELLAKLGIAEDVQTQIMNGMKENKLFVAGEENLDVRYGKLKTDHEGKLTELQKANELIADLQKSTKGNDDLQGKITTYETQLQNLQAENAKIKLESAIKVGLLAEKAVDIDYLAFKLKEKGDITIDENGAIKGWDDKLAGLKTQFPTQFTPTSETKKIDENKLKGNEGDKTTEPTSLADAIKMTYEQK
ncbi:MAG: phage scaffolding protein [Clostridiaceae bacterium]